MGGRSPHLDPGELLSVPPDEPELVECESVDESPEMTDMLSFERERSRVSLSERGRTFESRSVSVRVDRVLDCQVKSRKSISKCV